MSTLPATGNLPLVSPLSTSLSTPVLVKHSTGRVVNHMAKTSRDDLQGWPVLAGWCVWGWTVELLVAGH
jgi:hypothetical protein